MLVFRAIDFVDTLEAKGGTNINDALIAGIRIIQVLIRLINFLACKSAELAKLGLKRVWCH
jgi:hypothetical protein